MSISPRSALEFEHEKLNKQIQLMLDNEQILRQQHQELLALYNSSSLLRMLVPKADLNRNLCYINFFNQFFGNSVLSLTGDFYALEKFAHELSSSLLPTSPKKSKSARLSPIKEEDEKLFVPDKRALFRNLSAVMEADTNPTQDKQVELDTAKKNVELLHKSYSSFLRTLPLFVSSDSQYYDERDKLLEQAQVRISSQLQKIDVSYNIYTRLRIDDHNIWIETYRSLANGERRAKDIASSYFLRPIAKTVNWTKDQTNRHQVTVVTSIALTTLGAFFWKKTNENKDES